MDFTASSGLGHLSLFKSVRCESKSFEKGTNLVADVVISLREISAPFPLLADGGLAGSQTLRDSAGVDLTAQIDSFARSDVPQGFFRLRKLLLR